MLLQFYLVCALLEIDRTCPYGNIVQENFELDPPSDRRIFSVKGNLQIGFYIQGDYFFITNGIYRISKNGSFLL